VRYFGFSLREGLPLAIFVALMFLTGLSLGSFDEEFVRPGASPFARMLTQWWLYGLFVGALYGGWEQVTKSADYARHRGIDWFKAEWITVLVGTLILAAAVLASLILYGAFHAVFQPNAAIADWGQLRVLLCGATIALSAFGVGFWASSLPAPILVRLGLLAASVVLLPVSRYLASPAPDRWRASLLVFLVVQLSTFVLFSASAAVSRSKPRDEARPLSTRLSLMHALLMCSVLSIGAGVVARSLQRRAHMSLTAEYPSMAQIKVADQPVAALVSNFVSGVDGFGRVTAAHEPVSADGEIIGVHEFVALQTIHFNPWRERIRLTEPLARRGDRSRDSVAWGRSGFSAPNLMLVDDDDWCCFLNLDRRRLEVVVLAGEARPERRVIDGPPMSRETLILATERVGARGLRALLLEPAQRRLWACTGERAELRLSPVSLPAADVLVDWSVRRRGALLRGEGGLYRWVAGEFVPLSAQEATEAEQAEQRAAQVHIVGRDPLAFDVELADADGAPIATHRYLPRSSAEKLLERKLAGSALLRPPLLLCASYLAGGADVDLKTFQTALVLEPLVRDGKRTGFLLGVLGYAVVLAGLAFFVLLRRRAGGARAGAWALLVLCTGIWGWVSLAALELTRQPAPSARPTHVTRTAPLISTPRAEA